ncbi:peptidase [Bacillus infantis]|uniref:M15 family metallopeptidase n=1 Tax=Bacillus infantis TaxID=324767 RepID=UPI00101C149F|nr:M15 family metallopeptidase [Bacillus infantis]RYI24991.1 peptidase [Bacillus infantis]
MNLTTLLEKAERKLCNVHPLVREKAQEVIKRAYDKGIYVVITQGLRTIAEQNNLYAQGRTAPGDKVTNAKGGESYHNFGLAVDFAIANSNGTVIYWNTAIDTNKDGAKDWHQVGKIGQECGFEWGGVWRSFVDMPHLQYTFGLSLAQLRAGKKPPAYKPQPKKEEVKLFKPSSKALVDLTEKVLVDLSDENKYGKQALNKSWLTKLQKGELTESDATALVFAAISRGLVSKQ